MTHLGRALCPKNGHKRHKMTIKWTAASEILAHLLLHKSGEKSERNLGKVGNWW